VRPDYDKIARKFGKEAAADDQRVLEVIRDTITAFNVKVANYKRIRHISIRTEEFIKTPTKKIKRSRNV